MLSIVQDHGRHLVFRTLIPGSGILEWFGHQKEGDMVFIDKPNCNDSIVYIDASPNWNNSNFLGFALYVVLGITNVIHQGMYYLTCCIVAKKWSLPMMHDFIPLNFDDGLFKSDHLWLAYAPASSCKNWPSLSPIKITFSTYGNHRIIKSCGVCLVYTEDMSDDNATMIQHIYAPQQSCIILEEIEHSEDLEDSVSEDAISTRSLDVCEPSGN